MVLLMMIGNKKLTKFRIVTSLKCPRCKKRNVTQAKYCYKCGYKFKTNEIKDAKQNGLAYYLKMYFDWTEKFKITDWKIWKILSIILILYTGINYVIKNGYELKIENSNDYIYSYNKDLNEYYVYLNHDEENIKLYLPHEIKNLYVYHYNENNEVLSKDIYNDFNNIKITADDNNLYYYIIALNEKENKSNEIIKILTYTNTKAVNENE